MFSKNKDFQRKLTSKEKETIKKDQLGPLARKAAQIEHKRNLENFNRFNQDYVEAYNAERNVKRLPQKEKKFAK